MTAFARFQSTLSQGERRTNIGNDGTYPVISIHALARRATGYDYVKFDNGVISIHALARRATRYVYMVASAGFISIHALARRATDIKDLPVDAQTISIHALARRATLYVIHLHQPLSDFNPRSRKESDQEFQYATARDGNFNPRSRKESDRCRY